ncbi:MAG: aldehyde ferredoxin oxidoreductase family protein [Desulfobacterales bacterium]
MYGWTGNILRLDLSQKKITIEENPLRLREHFIGGRGANSFLLYDGTKPGIDPLGDENKIIFGNSPLTGTGLITSGRIHVSAKSPLTGILGDSNAGGHFGPELKWAGYDHLVVEGVSDTPVYIWIDDGTVEIRDANHLWGKVVSETYTIIRGELKDPRIRIAAIGPAGENLVRFASIMTDHGNACGKTGMGTVMGSKRLKAVAVRGTRGFYAANPARYAALAKEILYKTKQGRGYKFFSKVGTMGYLGNYDAGGRSMANNGQLIGGISYIENYSPQNLMKHVTGTRACFGCPIHCKHEFKIKKGPFMGEKGHGTEFCIMSAHGPACGNTDETALLKINNICNEYGICGDTSGVTLAAAFEWYQRGLIDKGDTDGLELEWGNYESQIQLLMKTICREGLGDILADGSALAAEKIGKGAENYISHAKGGDLDQVDVRSLKGCALSDAVSSRGADPQRGWPGIEFGKMKPEISKALYGSEKAADPLSYEGKGTTVALFSAICTMADTIGVCKFATDWFNNPIRFKEMGELLTAVTGVNFDEEKIKEVASRINIIERAYLVREGITRKDDTLHGRVMNEPVPSGPYKGECLDKKQFNRMLDDYYDIVGWDKTSGVPTRKTMEQLGLKSIADDLEKKGHLRVST